jgi:hypothetical protein
MKVTITVGAVELRVVGLDLTRKEVRRLLMDCAGIAAAMQPEEAERAPMGFSAHVEREPTEMAGQFYEDEE